MALPPKLPILWRNEGREYHADFIVVEAAGGHWIVELKSDKDVSADEVKAKRDAAKRWANYVNASDAVKVKWRYLLVPETELAEVKGSWEALKALGSE